MVVLMLNFKLQFVNVFMKILFVDPQGKHVPIEGKPGVALNLGLATLS